MQIWAESGKSALPICNYSQILYQFLTFTQNLKRSPSECLANRNIIFVCTFFLCIKPSLLTCEMPLISALHILRNHHKICNTTSPKLWL